MNKNLVENRELREQVITRVEVLEQVKEILTLGATDFVTVELAAKYYEVGFEAIKTVVNKNKEELESDGLRVLSGKEIKEILVSCKTQLTNFRGYFEIDGVKFANGKNTLIPKRALLRIGMLLRDSKVAKEVRDRLLDIVHDAETKTDIIDNVIEEIRTEQQISEDMLQAILAGDSNKLSILQTELLGLKNKRIAKLEETLVSSVTIKESRSKINMCIRRVAAYKYGNMFGLAWSDFYKFVNYKLGINIKARKGKGLDKFTDDEIKEIEVLAKCWIESYEIDVDFKL